MLNDISTQHTTGLYWVPGHAVVQGNETMDKLTRGGSIQKFVGPEPSRGVSRHNIKNKIKCWVDFGTRHGPGSTQRQAQKLILGPRLTSETRLLSFNRTQSRVVTGLLTHHNTLRRDLYLMGLINKPTCRKRGTEE